VIKEITLFSKQGTQHDDITLVILKWKHKIKNVSLGEVPSPDGRLKADMYADVVFRVGADEVPVVAVPNSAVIDSGTQQLVLVARGEGRFEPRPVKLGMRADGYVEVTEGLKAGEEVVVRANFLIDAESNLKAALESFGGQAAAARTHRGQGTIQAVDAQAGTVEIEHGPIETLKWPAMSMEFKVRDKAQLERLAKGQAVEFELSEQGAGEFVIERVAPGAPGGHAGHRG